VLEVVPVLEVEVVPVLVVVSVLGVPAVVKVEV